ncbi:hypothetical protein VP01_9442g1 [Puccinia sorghi]|uniref:Uncharacterized protein n=1 Tax=Puccinia sorghi TaxID=27349 RepID=A0A0L6U6L6_9BASI|nr:hypothetical protein VP01_9442g1 [Puccinia sorghi]
MQDKNGNDSTTFLSQNSHRIKTSATNRKKSNKLHELTQNLEVVAKSITCSAVWQQDFKWSAPITQEKSIINSNLCDEFVKFQDQIIKQSFKEKTVRCWGNSKKTTFQFSYQGNGDGPTCASVLANYYQKNQRFEEEGGSWFPRKCLPFNLSQDDNKT